MAYEIGEIIGKLPQKYVIAVDGSTLRFYAVELFGEDNISEHKEIARKFDLEHILGGGDCRHPAFDVLDDRYPDQDKSTVVLGSYSAVYGSVSVEVLENFRELLLNKYQKINREITNIKFEPIEHKGTQNSSI